VCDEMGFTHVKISVQNPARRERGREVELLIDTGAVISVIPKEKGNRNTCYW